VRWAASSWTRWRWTARKSTPTPAGTARSSFEHATKIEAQLKGELAGLLPRAEAADQGAVVDGMSIAEDLARREDRLAKLAVGAPTSKCFEQPAAARQAGRLAAARKDGVLA
jgi:hypothetical protein